MSCHHESCPSRRLFFQQMGSAALATLALSGLAPNLVLAESVRAISGATLTPGQRAYPVPTADSVSVDEAAGVIIVRAANHLYAFSTECPHRGAQLEFLAAEKTIYCRKHKARFGGDGSWLSGRRTRALDRFPIHVVNGQVVVATDTLLEQDIDGAAYEAAEVMVP